MRTDDDSVVAGRAPARQTRTNRTTAPATSGRTQGFTRGTDSLSRIRPTQTGPRSLAPMASGSSVDYVQLLLAWKSALDGPGPATLHVLPLTVSVRQ